MNIGSQIRQALAARGLLTARTGDSRSPTAIVNAIVAAAHPLDPRVVAAPPQRLALRRATTTSSPPMAATDIPTYLQNRRS